MPSVVATSHSAYSPAEHDSRFVAIILGASAWPRMPTLCSSRAFSNAHDRIRRYLESEFLLQENETLLDLFDSSLSHLEIDEKIAEFLVHNAPEGVPRYTDIMLFYTGHGDFTRQDQRFQLMLRSTNEAQKDFTGYQIRLLADTMNKHARKSRKLVILDCCYARAALPDFLLQSGGEIEDVVPEKIRQEAKVLLPKDTGVVLLCAASEDQWGFVADEGEGQVAIDKGHLTMFTYGLVNALEHGLETAGALLTTREVYDLVVELITDRFSNHHVKPILDAPKGDRDKLISVPLFPNIAKRMTLEETRTRKLEAELQQAIESNLVLSTRMDAHLGELARIRERLALFEDRLGDAGGDVALPNTRSLEGVWTKVGVSQSEWREWPLSVKECVLRLLDAGRNGRIFFAMQASLFVCLLAFLWWMNLLLHGVTYERNLLVIVLFVCSCVTLLEILVIYLFAKGMLRRSYVQSMEGKLSSKELGSFLYSPTAMRAMRMKFVSVIDEPFTPIASALIVLLAMSVCAFSLLVAWSTF